MAVTYRCDCGRSQVYSDDAIGGTAYCRNCKAAFIVPGQGHLIRADQAVAVDASTGIPVPQASSRPANRWRTILVIMAIIDGVVLMTPFTDEGRDVGAICLTIAVAGLACSSPGTRIRPADLDSDD